LLKRSLATSLTVVAVAIALACAALRAPDHGARETGRLFFWEVESPRPDGGSAHLLGSVHFGREDFLFDPAIQEAFEASDLLVMELDPDDVTPEKMSALLDEMGRLPEGETLADVLPPELYQALADRLWKSGYSIAGLDPFKPWVAVTFLSSLAIQSDGLSEEEGVESHFLERATGKIETVGLETPRQQMALFDALPPELQQEMLRGLLEEGDAFRDATDAIIEAWLRGDTERVAELSSIGSQDDEGARAFQRIMYLERNRNMAAEIARRIDQGGRLFVVVGAGHMVGAGGIPALLEERGYTVRQIEKTQ
jgi:uncharacterized protein YbaP (TraB family)